jgi:hypothetical protein
MTGSDVPPARASDKDRERAVRLLREAAVDGRLSHDSFVRRVDLALRARDHRSLTHLVADLAKPGSFTTALRTGLLGLVERRTTKPLTHPTLPLPDRTRPVLMIGRRADCDVVLSDETVSRVHAAIMLFAGQWILDDRGSTNGTRVNGRRVWGATVVAPGDRVSFGRSTFHLISPAADERT